MDTLTVAVQRALAGAPCSKRALVKAAGLTWSTVSMVAAGKRKATPAVVEKLAGALERWSKDCQKHAAALRRTLKGRA